MACSLSKLLFTAGLAICALLAGCKGGVKLVDDYGVIPPPSHPTVQLTDFTYSPGGSIRAGETMTLTATTNLPTANASINASARPDGGGIALLDNGQPPDATANDGLWTAEFTWPTNAEPTADAYYRVRLEFDDYYMWQELYSEKFEVLPAEEE